MLSALKVSLLTFLLSACAASASERVDMQLVLLADVSYSMDREERLLQQQGFARAFRHVKIVEAILGGPSRKIAVTYVEWGGDQQPRVIVPWTRIDSVAAAYEFSIAVERNIPSRLVRGTSISKALSFAEFLIDTSPFEARRNVINISGDGVNNNGPDLAPVRDRLVAHGIVINGMPIIYKGLMEGIVSVDEADMPRELLVDYYRNEVIGGPGAFIEPVTAKDNYALAIFKKLLREIEEATKTAGILGREHDTARVDVTYDHLRSLR
jgi:hypothetical protein